MVKTYRKGYRAELSLVHELSEMGFMAIRAPRSGRIGLASPDIIAAKRGKLLAIECKSRKDAFKVEAEQLAELREWVEKAGATAYVGWKQFRKGWSFLTLKDVEDNNGNINKTLARNKGLPINRL